jgi:hypothetical protein
MGGCAEHSRSAHHCLPTTHTPDAVLQHVDHPFLVHHTLPVHDSRPTPTHQLRVVADLLREEAHDALDVAVEELARVGVRHGDHLREVDADDLLLWREGEIGLDWTGFDLI